MGDIKRIKKKYETPNHPWIGSRIEEERTLKRVYGLRNKKEIWKMKGILTRFKDRAKQLIAQTGKQADLEREQLLSRMSRLSLLKSGATFDEILGLQIDVVMERRLQSILVKKNLARTMKQARQMITHSHVMVGGKMITAPGYMVTVADEAAISFAKSSAFLNEQHPERFSEEELMKKVAKKTKKAEEKDNVKVEEEAPPTFDEKSIDETEVLVGEKKADSKVEVKGES